MCGVNAVSAGAGPISCMPCAAQRVERRRDDFDLLAAEMAGFAGMRIEPADHDARRANAEARAQIVIENAQHPLQQLAA